MKVNNFMTVVPVHSIQKLYLSHNCCPGLAVFHKKRKHKTLGHENYLLHRLTEQIQIL